MTWTTCRGTTNTSTSISTASCILSSTVFYMLVATTYMSDLGESFSPNHINTIHRNRIASLSTPITSNSFGVTKLHSSNGNGNDNANYDANKWQSSSTPPYAEQQDWEETLSARQDGSLWSSFSSNDNEDENKNNNKSSNTNNMDEEDDGEEAWLDAIAQISADEIDFINVEADRADKVRQMQEMEFSSESIAATLGVEIDDSNEVQSEDNVLLEKFKEETGKAGGGFGLYVEEEYDMETVESHVMVEMDEETNEPIRQQMVYVDEHTCIGCTNCAMVAQSTFFMEPEHGRARVFEQWGDDEETVQIAIETCPVDCIHYVPYDELVRLEIERRDQNINFKARLVNQGEYGGGTSHRVGSGGANAFTAPQQISGNMKPRCNNCPSKGCKNCPMFGVGKNPYYEKKEEERKMRMAKRRMKEQMENSDRTAEL
mmetsp:Transcript_13886/g.21083  ORF Transcript_13886/g.21083 Transcript_13886/m.21083 type:complete len:430 (+) Transcript_13886:233-1522(+)